MPSAEGVVIKASATGLTLNRGRHYKVSPKLVAFSTYNLEPVALASTLNDYIQIGLDGDTVVWLSRVGVVQLNQERRVAIYQGDLRKVVGSRLYFADGTVLRLADGLVAPANPAGLTIVTIDADRGVVQGATFPPAPTTTIRTEKS